MITVGGYDDNNRLGNRELELYCSNYGHTIDGLVKPEIIAPAIWVAAPILPGADFYFQAEALSQLAGAPDYLLNDLAKKLAPIAGLPKSIHQADPEEIRATVKTQLKERKIIATHYQHVDGSSFAAPIVASVVAQMLEANPKLTHGMWQAEIELPAPGRYLYKFVIDDSQWVDDPSNGLKIDDHHGGFNSVLHIS